jgi:hypothetical protein
MTKLNLSSLNPNQDFAVIYLSNGNNYSQTQSQKLTQSQPKLQEKEVDLFVLDLSEALNQGILADLKPKQQGIVIAKKTGEVVWSKFEIDFKDLAQTTLDFIDNFKQNTDGQDMFCFGHEIKEEGDYMCNDCGYILSVTQNGEYQIGMAFPTCEVCQAGEPDGPSGSHEAFWQKL